MGKRNKHKKKKHRNKPEMTEEILMKPNATKLFIDENVFRKVMHWCDKASPREISGMGIVNYRNGIPHVSDAWLLKQKTQTGTSTEFEGEDLAKLQYHLHKENIKHDDLWWWHTHPTFGAFWSGTDEDTIHELGSQGKIWATVFNCKRELKSALYMAQPFHVWIDNLPTTVVYDIDLALTQAWDKTYDEKCAPAYTPPVYLGRVGEFGGKTHGNNSLTTEREVTSPLRLRSKDLQDLRMQGWDDADIARTLNNDDQLEDFDQCLDEIQKCYLNRSYPEARRELMHDGFSPTVIQQAWEFYFGQEVDEEDGGVEYVVSS